MPQIFILLLLAFVQGATEFLPVSSSGHLILLQESFGIDSGLLFDIFLHIGTLFAVCFFYRKDIKLLVINAAESLFAYLKKQPPTEDKSLHIVLALILATFFTATIGLILKPYVETIFRNATSVAILLAINATILWSSKYLRSKNSNNDLSYKNAIIIGIVQGLAVLPGISRSGLTITIALLLGIKAENCAKYSFLLSIPVILGALILEAPHIKNLSVPFSHLLLSIFTAAAIGLICLYALLKLLQKAKFHHFAWYCWALSALVLTLKILI